MPPAAATDFFVILYDMSTNIKDETIQVLKKILYTKLLMPSKAMCKIVLTNVALTSNIKGYKNICTLDINTFIPKEVIESIEQYEVSEANWQEALQVGIEYLKEVASMKGMYSLQLIFITDLSVPVAIDNNKMDKIIADLNDYNIFLSIVGPDVKPPHTILTMDDIKTWMKNLVITDENKNMEAVRRIVKETLLSVVCRCEIGIHLFTSFKKSKGSQPWLVPLVLGSRLEFPVRTSRVTKEGLPFKLIGEERVKVPDKWVVAEDESKEVDYSQMVAGIIRHGKFVKIPSEAIFKTDGERSFALLGFTDITNIPEYFIGGDATYCVLPDVEKSQQHAEAFAMLVDVMVEQKKYGIARRVYNKNNTPKFYVLVPKADKNPKCFYMAELPYADDVRYDYVEMDPKNAGKVEENDEIKNFLESLNVDSEHCKIDIPLAPTMMFDINCINLINKVEEKRTDGKESLKNVDIDYVNSKPNNERTCDMLKSVWPARQIVKVAEIKEDNDEFEEYGNMDFEL